VAPEELAVLLGDVGDDLALGEVEDALLGLDSKPLGSLSAQKPLSLTSCGLS
jgi:hypothetical protein